MTLGSLSHERWKLLEPLLDDALELEPERRSAFLDDVCRGDAELRTELGHLLAACAMGDTILSDPAAIAYGPLLAGMTSEIPSPISETACPVQRNLKSRWRNASKTRTRCTGADSSSTGQSYRHASCWTC